VTFTADPHERVTILQPTISAAMPAQEVDADGITYTTDGEWLTANTPGGAELWTRPVISSWLGTYGASEGTVSDNAGGTWTLALRPSSETLDASHFDAGGNLIEFFPSVGSYDTIWIADPSTGTPVISSTGYSTWTIRRPGSIILNEDIGDFAADIEHAVWLDSTNAILAARRKFDLGAGGITRARFDSGGTLLERVTHEPIGDYGIKPEGIGTAPDGIVVYSGELWIGPNDYPATKYRWIQVLDYLP